MPFTASAAQQAALPTNFGNGVITTQQALSSSATTHAAVDITGVAGIGVHVKKFGTPTADCSLILQVSMDGSNFLDYKTYGNAAITGANGLYDFVQVKAIQARFQLVPGTMTGANGFNTRLMV